MPPENKVQTDLLVPNGTPKSPAGNQDSAYPSVNTSTSINVNNLGTKKSAEFDRIVKGYIQEKNQ